MNRPLSLTSEKSVARSATRARVALSRQTRMVLSLLLLPASLLLVSVPAQAEEATPPATPVEPYYHWQMEQYAIKTPIGGRKGDATRGRKIVADRNKGNCLACHRLPIPEESFHGNIGPSLVGLATRLNEAQIRLRVVDEQQLNPLSIMPGYYRDPKLYNRVLWEYEGLTLLTAQQVEDVVAYLLTLK
jgi:sulfur-oxidizing protein SoxX